MSALDVLVVESSTGNASAILRMLDRGRLNQNSFFAIAVDPASERRLRRIEELDRRLADFRVSFADIGALDAAARGQATRAAVERFEDRAPAPIVKAVNPRNTGADIRRFIPRRAI